MLLDEISGVEVGEVGVGELCKLIVKIEVFVLLGGYVVGGGECVEICEVVRDVGCFATFVSVHGCQGVGFGQYLWMLRMVGGF